MTMQDNTNAKTVSDARTVLARRFALNNTRRRQEEARNPSAQNVMEGRVCWLCGEDVGAVVYDRRDLCLDCAEEVLRWVLVPLLAPHLESVDAAVETVVCDAAKNGLTSPVASPLLPPEDACPPPNHSGWTCWNCKAIQSDAVPRCLCCRKPRPEPPICGRCNQDVTFVKTCQVTLRKHVTWVCPQCKLDNAEEVVECRGCRKVRTWFCAACSLENPYTHSCCDACEGVHKLDTLSSMVNRDLLNQLGFSSDAQNLHREQQKKIEQTVEHTARLDRRVDQLGLFPIPIEDDGNCLFRALSFQLVRTDVFHPVVRHIIVDYMEAHRSEYALLIGGDDFESYVGGMRRNSIWGDELCVHAAARALGVRVHVITSDESRWHLRYEPQPSLSCSPPSMKNASTVDEASTPPRVLRQLFLCYRSPDHYYCIVHPELEPKFRTIDLEGSFRLWGATPSTRSPSSVPQTVPAAGGAPLPPPPVTSPPARVPNATRPATWLSQLPPPSLPPPTSLSTSNPPSPAMVGQSHVVVTLKGRDGTRSPPPLRRGPLPPSQTGAKLIPTTTAAGNAERPQQHAAQLSSPSVTWTLPPPPPPNVEGPSAGSISDAMRPVSRSMRNEVLQYMHFNLLPHPIMVRLCVASSIMNIEVTSADVVTQSREGAFFYLYPIRHQMILNGGEKRYPWGPLYRQTEELCQEARQHASRPLFPLFLLQHIRTGGFVCPGDDLTLRQVFKQLEPVHCAELFCRSTNQLASCLITIDEHFTESRSKLYLKFYRRELKCPYIGFVGDRPLFCCELPVGGSMLVVHQLFGGNPERLCLRCRQWYDGGRRSTGVDERNAEDCEHFSWVDETTEQIDRF